MVGPRAKDGRVLILPTRLKTVPAREKIDTEITLLSIQTVEPRVRRGGVLHGEAAFSDDQGPLQRQTSKTRVTRKKEWDIIYETTVRDYKDIAREAL